MILLPLLPLFPLQYTFREHGAIIPWAKGGKIYNSGERILYIFPHFSVAFQVLFRLRGKYEMFSIVYIYSQVAHNFMKQCYCSVTFATFLCFFSVFFIIFLSSLALFLS
jgi:hypothetical protein